MHGAYGVKGADGSFVCWRVSEGYARLVLSRTAGGKLCQIDDDMKVTEL